MLNEKAKTWNQMERFLHYHLIQLSPSSLNLKKEAEKREKLDPEELKNVLNSLFELIIAILANEECRIGICVF